MTFLHCRVSCEAIPEEISGMGTTPPSTENANEHPTSLKSQLSYPGAVQAPPTAIPTSSSTVPTSPTTHQAPGNLIQNRNMQMLSPLNKPPQSPTQAYSRAINFESAQKSLGNLVIDSKPPIGRNYFSDKVCT